MISYGIGKTGEKILTHTENDSDSISINQEVQSKRISHALLRGEVTEDVQELQYRTYKIDREAKEYDYFSPFLAKKRDKMDSKFVTYENSDNHEVITIQPNMPRIESVYDGLVQIGNKNGGRGKSLDYLITIKRDFFPRFRLEEYTKKLVVKKSDDERRHILDFYVSIYPNDMDFKSKGFVSEIKKIKDDGIRSDVMMFDTVHFVTSHAYNKEDMLEYEYKYPKLIEVVEFDGHYVVRFSAVIVKNGNDLTRQYYSKTMDEKYKNHTRKEVEFNPFEINKKETFICEVCGKEIVYDTEAIDGMNATIGRDINNEVQSESNVTEYFDIQMTEQTYGKRMCKECLEKYLEEIERNLKNE